MSFPLLVVVIYRLLTGAMDSAMIMPNLVIAILIELLVPEDSLRIFFSCNLVTTVITALGGVKCFSLVKHPENPFFLGLTM